MTCPGGQKEEQDRLLAESAALVPDCKYLGQCYSQRQMCWKVPMEKIGQGSGLAAGGELALSLPAHVELQEGKGAHVRRPLRRIANVPCEGHCSCAEGQTYFESTCELYLDTEFAQAHPLGDSARIVAPVELWRSSRSRHDAPAVCCDGISGLDTAQLQVPRDAMSHRGHVKFSFSCFVERGMKESITQSYFLVMLDHGTPDHYQLLSNTNLQE
jgi:hypothetical protein